MATHQGDENLDHVMVKKFAPQTGAKKNATPTDFESVRNGTTFPKDGPLSSFKKSDETSRP